MREFLGWWFPDYESHFPKMLQKNVTKGGQPVYQEPVRKRSIALCNQRRTAIDVGANVGLWSRDLCDNFEKVIRQANTGCLPENQIDINKLNFQNILKRLSK